MESNMWQKFDLSFKETSVQMKTASLTLKDVLYLLPRHELVCLSRFDPGSQSLLTGSSQKQVQWSQGWLNRDYLKAIACMLTAAARVHELFLQWLLHLELTLWFKYILFCSFLGEEMCSLCSYQFQIVYCLLIIAIIRDMQYQHTFYNFTF